MRHKLLNVATRLGLHGAICLGICLGLAGCPLQTPTFELVSSSLAVSASSAAPLVGDMITLTAFAPAGGADLSAATWQTSDTTIVSLSSNTGASVMAVALKTGSARLTVSAGTLRGSVTITVLASVSSVDLVGPTSLVLGAEATYTATVTDATGRTEAANVTWVANGTVALATPGANTGASMKIRATAVGPGAVTAQAGGRAAQIAVKVSATSGQLVITRADGTPIPAMLASGQALAVEASYEVTNEAADDAQWTATGVCALVGASGSTLSVKVTGLGACTLTASAKGMKASVTFTIVAVDGVKIVGDTSPLALGESRTFTAKALSGTAEVQGAPITWMTTDAQVLSVAPSGTMATVMAVGVGVASLQALFGARAMDAASLAVVPSSIQIMASSTRLVLGASAVVTARALGPTGLPGAFAATTGLSIAGATGFDTATLGALTTDGGVTFFLDGAKADSPNVTVSFGAVVSNTLSFKLATIAAVVVSGPQGPVRVGSTVDFTAMPVDAAGVRVDGNLVATWADATGVYTFPTSTTLHVTGSVVKLGTAAIVATVTGVASPAFPSPAQPGSIGLAPFSPSSIAVGGKATTVVTVLDAAGAPIPNVPLGQISVKADDATKVSFDMGAVMGTGFQFTGMALAPSPAAGVNVTATWTDGMYPVDSGAVPLVVTSP
jgi:hypothetical protein